MKKEISIEAYMSALDHPLKAVVELLRTIILGVDDTIAEQVKWNSPAFCYTGEMAEFDPKEYKRDIVVLNLHKKDSVLMVFPTGQESMIQADYLVVNSWIVGKLLSFQVWKR
ncbi:MAG: hypothetical protein IPN87_11570 [Saprospiraceae bacterium]|nr:hypothetical protein [Candidatus Brachybacter algidus]